MKYLSHLAVPLCFPIASQPTERSQVPLYLVQDSNNPKMIVQRGSEKICEWSSRQEIICFSPTTKEFIGHDETSLYALSLDGKGRRQLLRRSLLNFDKWFDGWAFAGSMSPDGKTLALLSNQTLILLDIKKGRPPTVIDTTKIERPWANHGNYPDRIGLAWNPSGKALVFTIASKPKIESSDGTAPPYCCQLFNGKYSCICPGIPVAFIDSRSLLIGKWRSGDAWISPALVELSTRRVRETQPKVERIFYEQISWDGQSILAKQGNVVTELDAKKFGKIATFRIHEPLSPWKEVSDPSFATFIGVPRDCLRSIKKQ